MPDAPAISPARGFIAEHSHYRDDEGFWEAQAARLGGPVIDLGAAAGRIAVPIAAAGIPVVAVDDDPEMLAVLRERAEQAGVAHLVTTITSPMQHASLPEGAPLVVCPMNTLQVLLRPADRQALFANVAAALAPGGEFVVDLSVPDFEDIAQAMGAVIPMGTSRDDATGDTLVHTAVYEDAQPATGTARFRLVVERPHGHTAVRTHRVHLYEPDEVAALAAAAGLDVLGVTAGFADEPFDPRTSERQVWRLARRADA